MADLQAITENLSSLTILEAAQLVKMLEEKWGVKAAAGGGMMMAMPVAGTQTQAAAAVEPTEFNVVLTVVGPKRIEVIKEVRAITGLGLKEAKDLVEAVPKALKEAVPKQEAEKIKAQMEGVGATIEITAA